MPGTTEVSVFILSNLGLLLAGGLMTLLSLRAYLRSKRDSYRTASVGFAAITVGSIVEAIYELGIRGSFDLTASEMLLLHTAEGFLIAGGLGLLFWSLRSY